MRFCFNAFLVWLSIVGCVVLGDFVGNLLPAPGGRYIFSPWTEGVIACLLFATAVVLSTMSPLRVAELLAAAALAQLTIAAIVTVVIGELAFDDFFWHWLVGISWFITPPFVAGITAGTLFVRCYHGGRPFR